MTNSIDVNNIDQTWKYDRTGWNFKPLTYNPLLIMAAQLQIGLNSLLHKVRQNDKPRNLCLILMLHVEEPKFPFSACLITYLTYWAYFPNSLLNFSISSSRRQITTEMSPSRLLGRMYARLSTGVNCGRLTDSGFPRLSPKSRL